MPTKPDRRQLLREDSGSNSNSRSSSRARTPQVDGEENGSLDFNFNNMEEILAAKLENLERVYNQDNVGDQIQQQATEMNKAKITSKDTTINDIIHSLATSSRTDVSSQSRELLLAQLYKLIAIRSLVVYNEANFGTKRYVDENKVYDLRNLLMTGNYRSENEFLLLFRSTIALICSDINEFGSLADGAFINHIKVLITEPPSLIITNMNKSHLITGLVSLLLIIHNGSSSYGLDSTLTWLFDLTEETCINAFTALREFNQGDREYSTKFDQLSEQRILDEIAMKQSTESYMCVAGLHGVACLLTLLPRGEFLNSIIEEMVPKLIDLLDNEVNNEVSKASGRTIAICYEIYSYNNDADSEDIDEDEEYNSNAPFYEQEVLMSTLERLTNATSKKINKKDKREVHSIFRNIYESVKNYSKLETRLEIYKKSPTGLEILNESMDSNYIKLSKTKTLLINSWFLYIRLIHLKWCFSFGVHNQLTGNDTIRDILHEPPSEYQLKYGESGPMDDEVFIESNYTSINDKHDQDYKSRTTKVRKARVNKLDEQMEELELK